jgi:hypothetical protein
MRLATDAPKGAGREVACRPRPEYDYRMRRAFPRVRKLLGAALGVLLAVALVTGFVRGGTRYFFCPLMQAISDAPCCDARASDGHDRDRVDADDCCEVHRLASVPDGSVVAAAGGVLDAPLVLVLSPPGATPAAERALRAWRGEPRTGPPRYPADASERRARLLVLTI